MRVSMARVALGLALAGCGSSSAGRDGSGGGGEAGGPGGGMPEPWMSTLDEAGCRAGINIVETGPPNLLVPTVGSGGGYGGIYCFALTP